LCGRDGRTICGPLRVPKSTYVTLAHKRKTKFFYFGCSLVRRCNCKQSTSANGTDGETDRRTDRQTDRRTDRVRRNMRPPPREKGRIINKNLCGRDGRTICGPQCVPKSTSVKLAVDEKTLPMATITGRTDRRTDRVRRNMRPPHREEGHIINLC